MEDSLGGDPGVDCSRRGLVVDISLGGHLQAKGWCSEGLQQRGRVPKMNWHDLNCFILVVL